MSVRMARRPVIGIPCSAYPDSWYTPANGNAISYLRAVEAAGGIPALIHLTQDEEVLDAHFRRCDALLLAGGVDVDPDFYGAERHPLLEATNPEQDTVEVALTRRAVNTGMPLLGICRGIQLLNVALGGTLYQDLDAELADALDHRESTKTQNMAHLAHPIKIQRDSHLAALLDTDELVVNTLHHQAVRDLAGGLRVVGQAPDGVIEAVEGVHGSFLLAVQCHPEELYAQADRRWTRVFEAFVAAARG
ncbi:MAG TPA: gamma-glutamyl-gamma-aminobutyrate hydrolase family protein [Roseiflexaceae bacterium]|nr:gamma-glutamyl-gamma-aminobutyrate hydrolase family protein [Roseiflexaceae bacterium]